MFDWLFPQFARLRREQEAMTVDMARIQASLITLEGQLATLQSVVQQNAEFLAHTVNNVTTWDQVQRWAEGIGNMNSTRH